MRHYKRGNRELFIGDPDEFNWLCFLFGTLWALFTRTWSVCLYYVALNVLTAIVLAVAPSSAVFVWLLSMGASLFLANNANRWRADGLVSVGYVRKN